VLTTRYPGLTVVADRLLDIYCQLTGERHVDPDAAQPGSPGPAEGGPGVAAPAQPRTAEDKTSALEGRALSLR